MSHRPPRVLIVEDDFVVGRMLADMLGWLGLEPDVSNEPRQALARLESAGVYELLVTDLMMPEMSGWELVEAVRARHPGLKVLLITAMPSPPVIERARKAGLRLLPKPFSMVAFRTAVFEALEPHPPAPSPIPCAPTPSPSRLT